MKKRVLLAMTTATLLMSACADKKLTTTTEDGRSAGVYGNGTELYGNNNANGTNSYGHESSDNVDPYGRGNYGNNSAIYADGTYGHENGAYAGSGAMGGVKNIYFNANQYEITADEIPIIHSNANVLRSQIQAGNKLKVEGHCDASGSDEYNYALGLRRASAVKNALINKGINSNSILMISMGESSPECTSSTSSGCYAKNRRAEFKLVQ